jgi:hypothetical protein
MNKLKRFSVNTDLNFPVELTRRRMKMMMVLDPGLRHLRSPIIPAECECWNPVRSLFCAGLQQSRIARCVSLCQH